MQIQLWLLFALVQTMHLPQNSNAPVTLNNNFNDIGIAQGSNDISAGMAETTIGSKSDRDNCFFNCLAMLPIFTLFSALCSAGCHAWA